MLEKQGIIRFLKYAGVGGSTFLFDLVLLYIFIDVFALQYLLAAGVAFVIAVSINYIISRKLVFWGTERAVGIGYVHFLSIAGTGLIFVVGAMYVLVGVFGVHYVLARVGVALLTGMWNYLMNLYVNFKVAGKHEVQ